MAKSTMAEMIPEKFYKANVKTPKPRTVKDLIALLEELPKSLPVLFDINTRAELVVFNASMSSRFVTLREAE